MTALLTLDIDAIAAGGDGVARQDGFVVFVPRTAPGDRVVARVEKRKRFGRGRVERIERTAPERVEPACPHYVVDDCGGCQLQHLSIDAQLAAKRAIVADAVRRIAKRTIADPVMHPAPDAWRYRQRISVAMRRRGGAWYGGFHTTDAPDRVFDLVDCRVADARVMDLWHVVRAASANLPAADALRVSVRAGDAGCAVHVEGGTSWPGGEAFVAALPDGTGVWWTPHGGARRRIDAAGTARAGASFEQVNPSVARSLLNLVYQHVMAQRPSTVVDAYAGSGDLAARLHADGVAVAAIEMDEEAAAVTAARVAPPSRAIAARVEDVIAGLLPADVVVLNPPRSGVDARVADTLDAANARAIVYVSCDPATMSRDLVRMPSWSVAAIDCFDMFPQTAHVETVVRLVRSAAA